MENNNSELDKFTPESRLLIDFTKELISQYKVMLKGQIQIFIDKLKAKIEKYMLNTVNQY